jgi:hypothetical protein
MYHLSGWHMDAGRWPFKGAGGRLALHFSGTHAAAAGAIHATVPCFCVSAQGCSPRPGACKIQQNYKPLPHRTEFAFEFNTPAKRPLGRNKRNNKCDNKPEQVKEQARRRVHVRHQTKRPAGQFQPGATREFQFHEYSDLRLQSRFPTKSNGAPATSTRRPAASLRISSSRC